MEKKIKIGIIGVGNIAEFHIRNYLADSRCELYAFCDINEENLKAKGEKHGISRLYTDKDEMLKECSELDAVSVCTWNATHAECTIAALNAGKHVICEKPMAMNAEEAKAMKDAAERNNKLLMIGFVRRYGKDCGVTKDFIDSGDFGELYYAKATYLRRAGAPGGWFGRKEYSGGGPLIDLGVHVIDLSRYLAGNPKPVSVYCATFNKLGRRENLKLNTVWGGANKFGEFNVEDFASAIIRFENGFVIALETSFSLNVKKEAATIQLFGTKAGAILNPELEIITEKNDYLTNISFTSSTSYTLDGLFESEIKHFIDCMVDGAECISPAEDGIVLMKILDAAYKSAATGHEVIIE